MPRETEFTCPSCGGHLWGSSQLPDGSWQRYCHTGRCKFRWHQRDDDKYMVPTGSDFPDEEVATEPNRVRKR